MAESKIYKYGRRKVVVTPPKAANADFVGDAHLMTRTGSTGDYHYGTSGYTYPILYQMANVAQIAAIHQVRTNQAGDVAKAQESPLDLGWRLSMCNRHDIPLRKDRIAMAKAAEVIERAGGDYLPGGFEQFLRVIIPDSLIADQVNFEIIRERDGTPVMFVPADPTTIRRAVPFRDGNVNPRDLPGSSYRWGRWDYSDGYVQVMPDGRISAEFAPHEMAWGIRRPRSGMRHNGYGHPELEQLANIITGLVNAQTFNQINFTTGIHAHTALVLSAAWNPDKFDSFKRELQMSMAGGRNFKRIPVLQINKQLQEDLSAITLGKSNSEMEFSEWINWLLKVACSLYNIDPSELGYIFGNEGQKTQLVAASANDRVLHSKERGLRPLLRSIASWINYWIIQPTWPNIRFSFAGFDTNNERDKHDMDMAAVTTYRTPNEIRAERGFAPLATPVADLPLNAFFSPAAQAMLDADVPPPQFDIDTVGAFVEGRRLPPMSKPA